jgi:hypothetical protein
MVLDMDQNISDDTHVALQRSYEEFPTMHGLDAHGGAAISMAVSLLANQVHFSRITIALGHRWAHMAEVLRQRLDGSRTDFNRLQQSACI